MAAAEINRFLTYLAVEQNVAASTQNQAFAAILFLYKEVLHVELGRLEGIVRGQKAQTASPWFWPNPRSARSLLSCMILTFSLPCFFMAAA